MSNSQSNQVNHWCRVAMNRETNILVNALNYKNYDVLEISGTGWRDFGFRSYSSAQYPAFDICSQKIEQSFDLIIAEQVFEHLRYPARAAKNVLDSLRAGGHFLITTPFLIKNHPSPNDYWRWTAQGMQAFLEDVGFHVLDAKAWGNRMCVTENFDVWPMFDQTSHSLENEVDFPLVVWALAKKII